MPSLFIVAAIERSQGSLYSEKATGIVLPMISVKSCQEKIWEEKVLVYLEKEDAAHIKIGNKLKIKGKASAFETARNPGNFDQRAYYKGRK